MKISLFMQQQQQIVRMAAILVIVGLVDALVVVFAAQPLPWAIAIPALIPLLTAVFVIIPFIRASKQ